MPNDKERSQRQLVPAIATHASITSEMEIDRGSIPLLADVVWRMNRSGRAHLCAEVHLEEDGTMSFCAEFGDEATTDSFPMTRDELRAAAQDLTAFVARVDAEYDGARQLLATWRSRLEQAFEPLP